MKARLPLLIVLLAVAVGLALGCSRAKSRTDAEIATDVQGKIYADRSLQNPQVTVNSSDGVVTLTGTVASQADWNTAANDAAQVDGVKRVVNNLQVYAAEQTPPPLPEAESYAPPSAPVAQARPARRTQRAASGPAPGLRRAPSYRQSEPVASYSAPASEPLAAAPAPARPVTVPEGTTLSIRLIDSIDSEKNSPGDTFRASVDSPVTLDDQVVIPANADVVGRIVTLQSAGRFAGRSAVAIELTKLVVNGRSYDLHTDQFAREGSSRGKATAAKVGGGAALGAIIGGIAGGGKGAAIGGAVGAGAGTGVSAATKGQQIRLTSEQVLNFRLESPLTVIPQASSMRHSGRQRLD
jgi:hypothetical protein